ncbi:MAG: hypothetical protein JKY22_12375 [Flavobacteriaceae bacterium]|nr:hypothetical protein [Flavobacteriaceae bacterium]
MTDLDTPEMEPSTLFYQPEEVKDLEETTEDVDQTKPVEATDEVVDSEESESEEQENQDEIVDNDNRIVDIDGRELSVATILEWEKGRLMQSDYTRKRQADAEAKRVWEADKQGEINAYVSEKHSKLSDSILNLEVLVKEADESINWEELREFDPSEYLLQKELKEKRIDAVNKGKEELSLKPENESSPEFIKAQADELTEANPSWLDKDGNKTEAHKNDLKMLADYLTDEGYTQNDQNKIKTAKHWKTLLDAARYKNSLKKVEEVKATVKKLPITTRPKKSVSGGSNRSMVDYFYGKN